MTMMTANITIPTTQPTTTPTTVEEESLLVKGTDVTVVEVVVVIEITVAVAVAVVSKEGTMVGIEGTVVGTEGTMVGTMVDISLVRVVDCITVDTVVDTLLTTPVILISSYA